MRNFFRDIDPGLKLAAVLVVIALALAALVDIKGNEEFLVYGYFLGRHP